jgi:hypothetical protein
VEDIALTGSLFSLLSHQIASVIVSGTVGIPGVEQFVFALTATTVVFPCRRLDRMFPARRKFPLGYVVVASRS